MIVLRLEAHELMFGLRLSIFALLPRQNLLDVEFVRRNCVLPHQNTPRSCSYGQSFLFMISFPISAAKH